MREPRFRLVSGLVQVTTWPEPDVGVVVAVIMIVPLYCPVYCPGPRSDPQPQRAMRVRGDHAAERLRTLARRTRKDAPVGKGLLVCCLEDLHSRNLFVF
jgi:hypothetical protein